LGTKPDERMTDDLRGKSFKSYYLDYNFPAYSVGEVRFERGPGRRDMVMVIWPNGRLSPLYPPLNPFPIQSVWFRILRNQIAPAQWRRSVDVRWRSWMRGFPLSLPYAVQV
jgi:hypothetical protein